jgi:hypothetical protein
MAKRKIMKLSQGLVLNRYLLSLFGCSDFEGMAQYLKDSHLEGYDENNVTKFHQALKMRLLDSEKLNKDLLFEYDQNIVSHTLAISEYREGVFKWKYFQYITLLFVEIYLDKYFANKHSLLKELNEFVDAFNNPLDYSVPNDYDYVSDYFTANELSKIAIWSATGSGKTLLLHVNIKQYLHYAKKYGKKDFNKVLLVTPNEGLSNQHLSEFKESNIKAEIFSKTSGALFSGEMVEIIEISKLTEEGSNDGKSVAVDAFETNNLVLIDEGHRGASGDEWKKRRDQLSENGFAFEYSATFGQAISAASGNKKEVLFKEYSKAILFDYSYKYFYKDGYGKDYKILNIKDDNNDEYLRKYLTACLLGYYQQQLVYNQNSSKMDVYKLAKPLWVFVGGKVNSVSSKTITDEFGNKKKLELSDVITIVKFISDFIKDPRNSRNHINQILSGNAGLNDENGASIFSNSFDYLKENLIESDALYPDILQKVFNTSLVGANVHLDNLKGADGELGLRIGDTDQYFGVINVGDEAKLHKLCMDVGIKGMEKEFSESLFHNINEKDSNINLLIGSKKFTEGWSSWRVSTMGLMNIGKGEGSQIIQLFGRGVRLKGFNMSLKRSSRLDEYQRPKDKTPKFIPTLETLNIFGIKADYMQQFKEYLEEEGLPTNEGNFKTITIPTINRYSKTRDNLKIIKTKEGVAENYKKENITVLEITEASKYLEIKLDWYPKIQMISSNKSTTNVVDGKDVGLTLKPHNLAFIDWDKVFFEIQKYKNERSWYNLSVTKENLQEIISNDTWYEISIPSSDLEPTSFNRVFIWEELVIALLKNYTEKFYLAIKNKFLARHIEVSILEENHPNFTEEYSISIEETETDIIRKVLDFKELVKKDEALQKDFELNRGSFVGFDYGNHLYYPLLYMNDKMYKDIVKVSPVQLNEGEKDFVNDLKQFYNANKTYFNDKKVYLLRNQSKTGIGFLTETKNFYPDFMLWQIIGDKQYLSFIDPKGIYMLEDVWNHPKVRLHKTIKEEFQSKLADKNTFLNSFIISNTSFKNMQYRRSHDETIEHYHNANVYFQDEDKHTYIEKVLEKGLIE